MKERPDKSHQGRRGGTKHELQRDAPSEWARKNEPQKYQRDPLQLHPERELLDHCKNNALVPIIKLLGILRGRRVRNQFIVGRKKGRGMEVIFKLLRDRYRKARRTAEQRTRRTSGRVVRTVTRGHAAAGKASKPQSQDTQQRKSRKKCVQRKVRAPTDKHRNEKNDLWDKTLGESSSNLMSCRDLKLRFFFLVFSRVPLSRNERVPSLSAPYTSYCFGRLILFWA